MGGTHPSPSPTPARPGSTSSICLPLSIFINLRLISEKKTEMIMKLYKGEMFSINHGRHCVRRKFIKSERERQFEDVLPRCVWAGGGGVGWAGGV